MAEFLKTGNIYGASVGHRTVFTRQAAIDRYKLFLRVCENPLTAASSVVLGEVEDDLVKIGFSREELEEIEIEYLKSLN